MLAAVVAAPVELLDAGLDSAFVKAMGTAQGELDFAASHIVGASEAVDFDFQTISAGIVLGASHKVWLSLTLLESLWLTSRSRSLEMWRTLGETGRFSQSCTPLPLCIALRDGKAVSRTRYPHDVPPIVSIAGCYEKWMPELATNSKIAMSKLACSRPSLSQPFPGTAFNSTTLKFGPSQGFDFGPTTYPATGVLAITSAGNYDRQLGGHLVLKEWNVVIETPPCSTVLIPAEITRGVVPIPSHQTQVTIIQHASTVDL